MPKINDLLEAAGSDQGATAELFSLVYDELRRLAATYLSQETPGHTLQPTALVHEAYLRLVAGSPEREDGPRWQGRAHFFGAAAQAMRRILIDAARRKKREKHGGGRPRQPLDPDQIAAPEADDLLALDEALTRLAMSEPVVAELVNLRYFGGLTLQEAATVLGVSARTAGTYWALLGPLGYHGGPTPTFPLLPGSPAINAGDNTRVPAGVSTDQRGSPRIADGKVDLGAFEAQ